MTVVLCNNTIVTTSLHVVLTKKQSTIILEQKLASEKNNEMYTKYKALANKENKIIFGGRLGEYKYYDMDKVIEAALELVKEQGL